MASGGFIASIVKGVVDSLLARFCPPKTAADAEVDVLREDVKVLAAEAKAKANAPTKLEALIASQREGKV